MLCPACNENPLYGKQQNCKKCAEKIRRLKYKDQQKAYYKEWYSKTHRGRPESKRKLDPSIQASWVKSNPEKQFAQTVVAMAVRKGLLVRAANCSLCHKETKTHGHHHDYKLLLDVIWLCPSCHKQTHCDDNNNLT